MVVKIAPCVQTESRPLESNVQLIENRPHLHCKDIYFSTVQFRYTLNQQLNHLFLLNLMNKLSASS